MSIRPWTCALIATFAVGCGGNTPPPEAPKKQEQPAAAEAAPVPDGAISRRDLEAILREGPPWVLQQIAMEEVMKGDKFVGWRLQEVPVSWRDVDLRAGDVVIKVNTLPLETPSDFWAAWTTLSVASELQVAYLRDGEKMEVSVPIIGAPNPSLGEELAHEKRPTKEGPPDTVSEPQRRGTIVIKGEDRPLSDTLVDWSN